MTSIVVGSMIQFVSWWHREIAALIPSRRPTSVFKPGLDGLSKTIQRAGRCVVLIDESDVIIERLELPSAAYWRLSKLVQFKVAADWPVTGVDPNYSWRIDHQASSWSHIAVDIAMADSDRVSEAVEAARAAGFRPEAVDVQRDSGDAQRVAGQGTGLNFLVNTSGQLSRIWRFEIAICGALLVLTVGLLWTIATAATEREADARDLQAKAMSQAAPILNTRRVLNETSGWISQATDDLIQFGTATENLETIAAVLPDDAFLTSLDRREGELILKGEAKSASQVLAAFDREPSFGTVQFGAPVVRIPSRAKDRFQLRISPAGLEAADQ